MNFEIEFGGIPQDRMKTNRILNETISFEMWSAISNEFTTVIVTKELFEILRLCEFESIN